MAEVPREADDLDPRIRVGKAVEDVARLVDGAVIDRDELPVQALERGLEAVGERLGGGGPSLYIGATTLSSPRERSPAPAAKAVSESDRASSPYL